MSIRCEDKINVLLVFIKYIIRSDHGLHLSRGAAPPLRVLDLGGVHSRF
jgi:hypothetical protein